MIAARTWPARQPLPSSSRRVVMCVTTPAPDPGRCPHCRLRVVTRPARGLCYRCVKDAAVLAAYPLAGSKYARRGVGNLTGHRPLPAPTAAPPGTPAKVAVLEQRAAGGLALFHPADAVAP